MAIRVNTFLNLWLLNGHAFPADTVVKTRGECSDRTTYESNPYWDMRIGTDKSVLR